MVKPNLRPNKFYYNFFKIKKGFNIYVNLKHIVPSVLMLNADFFT